MSELMCKECGFQLAEGSTVCPECGSPVGNIEVAPQNVPTVTPAVRFCSKCGTQLTEDHAFCPKCGTKSDTGTVKSQSKNKIIIPIIAVICIALIVIGIVFLATPKVESVTVSQDSIDLKVSETFQATYTVNPSKASKVKAEWASNNEAVATVTETGFITAVSDGTANITVTAKGKSATIVVTVKSGPDFQAVYREIGSDSYYCTLAKDNSYLSIDTNPLDIDDFSASKAWDMIVKANRALGLPESVDEKMGHTSSMDGRQTDTYNGVKVSWKYHPDQGLEVTYEAAE